jgi:hypothetical protein
MTTFVTMRFELAAYGLRPRTAARLASGTGPPGSRGADVDLDATVAQRLCELSAEVAELESQLVQSLEVPSVATEARLRELLSGLGDTAVQVFTEGGPKVMHRFSIGLELTYDDRTDPAADIELANGCGSIELGR